MEFISNSEKETKKIGKDLTKKLRGGDILCLYGDLGAGKTALTKGIATGFGIKENITSPTFTLMNVYEMSKEQLAISKLVHIDTYRLENEKQLIEIGAGDYLGAEDTVSIIEWPEKIKKLLLYKKVKIIEITHLEKNKRKILFIEAKNTPLKNNKSESLIIAKKYLGKNIKIKIDRPVGTKYKGMVYTVNYGYIPNIKAPDGSDLDAYYLNSDKPLKEAEGKCIAIIHRLDDDDDKLIIANKNYSKKEIEEKINFSEKYFKHVIIKK